MSFKKLGKSHEDKMISAFRNTDWQPAVPLGLLAHIIITMV